MYVIIFPRFFVKTQLLEDKMEETINLRELYETLRKRLSLIVAILKVDTINSNNTFGTRAGKLWFLFSFSSS